MGTNTQKKQTDSFLKIALPAIFCTILWGSAFPTIKIGYQLFNIEADDIFKKILFAGIRFATAGIVVFIILLVTKQKITTKKENIPDIILLAITQTVIQYAFFYISLAHMAASKGSMMNATSVFFSVLFAHFMFKDDRMTSLKAIGCILGFAGVFIVNFSSNISYAGFSLMGEGFMLISATATGISYPIIKRLTNRGCPPMVATAWQLLTGGLILSVVGLIGGGKIQFTSYKHYLLMGHLVFISAVASSIWSIV